MDNVQYKSWHYVYRAWDQSATICTIDGYCICVKPQYTSVEEWEPIAKSICEAHNNSLPQPNRFCI